ncbi:NipSnap protein K02D10.1 [Aphelenchoides bicaudatus]|nr:NipSnap protein K02D10.1 [Aphelenchoides bicaudatus]
MPPPQEIFKEQLFANYDTFLFDADGVLWLGDRVIEGAVNALNQLVSIGKRVIIISNNATMTPAQFAQKILRMGFSNLDETNIVNSSLVLTHLLANDPNRTEKSVYLIGTQALADMLTDAGVKVIGVGADPVENYTQGSFVMDVDIKEKVFAVVASFDSQFNYVKLMKAANYLKDEKIAFYATNQDLTFPGSVPGVVVPGAGWTSISVGAVSGRQPTVMGKPHTQCFDYIHQRFNIDPARTLMVGDRLDTDILFGNRNQIDTLLVLTGVNTLSHVLQAEAKAEMDLVPKFFAASISVFNDDKKE